MGDVMTIKHIHIFDCDGVLLDSSHRYRTDSTGAKIDLPYWAANCIPEKIWADEPLPTSKLYKMLLGNPEHYVIIATARVCQQADFDCIEFKLGMPNKFISRKKGDNQSGVTLKLNPIKQLLSLKQFRNAKVSMYEDNLAYLHGVGEAIGAKLHYIPSIQGH
jgi:hypothetical protein